MKSEFINTPNYWKPLRDFLAIYRVFDLLLFFFFLTWKQNNPFVKKERQCGIVTLYNLLWLNACDTVFIWYSSLEMPLLCYMLYSFFISSHRKLKGRFAKDAVFSSVTLTLIKHKWHYLRVRLASSAISAANKSRKGRSSQCREWRR